MSIRPIDPMVMNNTPHAEKIASVRAVQDENAQAQSAMAVKKDDEHKDHKVSSLRETASENKINRDSDKEKRKNGGQNKKDEDEDEDEDRIKIDIRI